MKKKTYWTWKDKNGEIDINEFYLRKMDANFWTPFGYKAGAHKDAQKDGWKLIKVKIVEVK